MPYIRDSFWRGREFASAGADAGRGRALVAGGGRAAGVPAAGRRRPGRGVRRGRERRAAAAAGRAVRAGAVVHGARSAPTSTPRSARVCTRCRGGTSARPPTCPITATMVQLFIGGELVKTHARKDTGQADRPGRLPAGEDRVPHAHPGLVPQAGRRDRPGLRAADRRAARQTTRSTGSAPPRACSDWPTSTNPARLEAACAKARRRGPVLPDGQGHPGRRHRATRCRPRPGTAAPRRSCTARRRSPTSSRCPARSPATPSARPTRRRPRHDQRRREQRKRPSLAAHVRVIRAAADLLEQAGITGLYVWPDPDEIAIQVPEPAGDAPSRAAAVARLAALTGGEPAPDPRPGKTRGWIHATRHVRRAPRAHLHPRQQEAAS